MSRVYQIEMDQHQLKLVVESLQSLVQFQMDVAAAEADRSEVVHLVHDSLAIKRILKQIEIQYGQTYETNGRIVTLYEE